MKKRFIIAGVAALVVVVIAIVASNSTRYNSRKGDFLAPAKQVTGRTSRSATWASPAAGLGVARRTSWWARARGRYGTLRHLKDMRERNVPL
jgi:hypothetical protein